MMFRDVLAKIVDQTPGGVAGAIMGMDGIPVEEYVPESSELDLASVAVEFQRVLDDARKAAGALYGDGRSGLHELILVTAGHQLLFRHVDDEYFLVVALEPSGVLGKARYLVRSVLAELRAEL